jgi:PII-like signaling protein
MYPTRQGGKWVTGMNITEGMKLTIYVGKADRYKRNLLFRAIVEVLRAHDIAGATVLHGIEGYGVTKRLHTSRILDLSSDLPVVIMVIDASQKIEAITPTVREMVKDGLVTIEHVAIVE